MPSDPPSWTQTGGKLDGANELFHAAYDGARGDAEQRAPVLIFLGDQLILHRGGSRRELQVTPAPWLAVRSAAHAPVALFSLLARADPGRLPARTMTRLEELRQRLAAALPDLPRELPDAEALADVRAVLSETLSWLERTMREGTLGRDEVSAFARRSGKGLLRLTDHATRLQLSALHAQVDVLLADLSPHELSELQVVVAGAHQARDRSLGMQYFRKRLNEPQEEDRVAYAENAADEKAALALVGIRKFDGDIASAFFGDPKRLQRDVLGDAAAKLLDSGQPA